MFLVSSEGKQIEINLEEFELSEFIKNESKNDKEQMIVLNFSEELITKVIKFCEFYKKEPLILPVQEPIQTTNLNKLINQEWYIEYVNVNSNNIFQLMNIAYYLQIDPLIELTCLKIATVLKGKDSEEMLEQFSIKNKVSEEDKIIL